jgi:hypothetical protein
VADRTVLAEVNGPLGQVRPRPIGITAAAVILIVLWSTPFLEGAIASLRCTILLLSKPTQCDSAMHVLALDHDWSGYTGTGTALAFGALGVIAGVRLLGLRSRGLALGLAWVGILMWLAVLGFVPGPHPGLGSLAIYVLGVAGYVYVILALRRWRDRFENESGSVGTSLGTSTLSSTPVPRDSRPDRFRSVVVVAGAGLVLVGAVLALPGLVVFIDWIAGAFESAAPTGAFCPPSSSYCTAASAKAGVLGLLAVSVGVLGFWTGIRLLRKTRAFGAEEPARNHRRIVTKGRGLVVVSALILTTLVTAGLLLYARPVHEPTGSMVTVLVSKVDIPARTDLDQLIKDDQFKLILVPLDVVEGGTVTSVDRLSHRRTRVAVLSGEPILAGWLKNEAELR